MKKIIIAILLFFITVYILVINYYPNVQINKYPDLETVKANEAIQRGRVPAILPVSAHHIVETHEPDKDTIFGSFYYKKSDEERLMQNLKSVPDMDQTYEWENFLFKVDQKSTQVKYRNKPIISK